jgi:hypothetical protein
MTSKLPETGELKTKEIPCPKSVNISKHCYEVSWSTEIPLF